MKKTKICTATALLALSGTSAAESGPAVEGYNGKLSIQGGMTDQPGVNNNGDSDRGIGFFDGSLSIPLTYR